MNFLNKFFLPPARSNFAADYDKLFNFIHIASFILLAAITITIVVFVIKYRRRSEHDVTPIITDKKWLEVTWTVIPLFLVLFIFGWGFRDYMQMSTPPQDAYEIHVTAQKWLWTFNYANGAKSTGTLHVPAGKPVKLIMQSKDVIHSFYVPAFRVKRDVRPNAYSSVWFTAMKPDTSDLFCAEYCGTGHSGMTGKVVAQSPEHFNNWLQQAASGGGGASSDKPLAEQGKALFEQNACSTCHSLDGSIKTGPSFKGVWGSKVKLKSGKTVTVDANYVRESILHPQAKIVQGFPPVMPTFQGTLDDHQINALIEFIKKQQ